MKFLNESYLKNDYNCLKKFLLSEINVEPNIKFYRDLCPKNAFF